MVKLSVTSIASVQTGRSFSYHYALFESLFYLVLGSVSIVHLDHFELPLGRNDSYPSPIGDDAGIYLMVQDNIPVL